MVGRDKSRTHWKILKIDRSESSELNISEDPTTYTEAECSDILRRINEGNRVTGGLNFVTLCYGIVGIWIINYQLFSSSYMENHSLVCLTYSLPFLLSGFIKFLGPYYMVLITKRKLIGVLCGHNIYAISKSEIIPLPNPAVRSSMVNFRSENR